jgi:N-methylhydantoinase A
LTGAANLLGYVPADDYAAGNIASTRIAWQLPGVYLGLNARQALDIAIDKVMVVVNEMISECKFESLLLRLQAVVVAAACWSGNVAKKSSMKLIARKTRRIFLLTAWV